MRLESLVELWRITERRNGETYKTEYVKDVWVELSSTGKLPSPPTDMTYSPKSDPNLITLRRIK